MQLYLPEGWLNIPAIRQEGYPFVFITGGRGTGKTYGALQDARKNSVPGNRFLFMRRTQTQLDTVIKLGPYKELDADNGYITMTESISPKTYGFYNGKEEEDGQIRAGGPPIGYAAALRTFASLRGWDASDVTEILLDEFIPQLEEPSFRGEAEALWNCYETVNRNRELKGKPPVQLIGLSNSNSLGNPVFLDLGLVRQAEKMLNTKKEIWTDDARGIMLIILQESPISEAKRMTALYKMQQGTEFSKMALDNNFVYDEHNQTARASLRDLVPIVHVGEICIYRMKNGNGYYVSGHVSGSPDTYGTGAQDLKRFRTKYGYLWSAHLSRRVFFEEYTSDILFNKYFKI